MRCLFFLLFTCLCLITCLETAAQVDSLKAILERETSSKAQVSLLRQLAEATVAEGGMQSLSYAEQALETAMDIADERVRAEVLLQIARSFYDIGLNETALNAGEASLRLCRDQGYPKLEADVLYLQGSIYYGIGDLTESRSRYQQCLSISEFNDYREGIAKASKGLGDLAETSGDYDAALTFIERNLSISIEVGDKLGQMSAHNDLGRINEAIGSTEKALESYLQVLRLGEEEGNHRVMGVANGNIGSLYLIQKNYPKAKEYAFLCLDNYIKAGNRRGEAFAYQDIAQVLKMEGSYDEALEYYHKALSMRTEMGDKRGLSFTYYGMGNLHERREEWSQAQEYYEKSYALREELGFKMGMSSSLSALGKVSMNAGQYNRALTYFKRGLALAQEIGGIEEIMQAYGALASYYEKTGDYRNAFAYQKLFQDTRDSLFNEDQNRQFANMQTLYETEKKEKQILEQENDILELENSKAKIMSQRNYLMGGSLAVGLLGLFGFQWNKVRKERNDKIAFAEALIFAQEEERKRIARDLHDGVGQSLLLIKKQIEKNTATTLENQNLITTALEEVRSISHDLHPFQLEKFGVTTAINEAILKVERSTDVFITREINNIDNRLSEKAEINLYRAVQEALSNVVKHADATAAKVEVRQADDWISVLIRDNGKGFDHEMAVTTSKSLGLRTMNERLSAVGGKLGIRKNEPRGTIIEMTVPVV